MIKPLDKIVIVGGGSAGWITAAALIRVHPQKNIILIESPNVPTVGVGESTLGQFKQFCSFLDIDEADFMRHTDASYKMSIQFTDFYEKDAGSFHYPFGEPYLENTNEGMNDWFIKKALYPETPITDFVDSFFPAAALFNTGKYSRNLNNEFNNFSPLRAVAYHFDAVKFAIWLRDRYCKPRGVKHIQATVTDMKVNDDIGIEKLVLNTGDEITADLFIDCTGFRSLLIGQALKQEFFSYSHILPNNRAWAAQVPYKDKKVELEGFTNCTAIGNGWVWNTPVWTRLGTGYVYSDKFIDPEDAKEEFKQHLMSKKMLIPRSRDEVESLNFKDVPMRIGAYKKSFVKNVVAIGLSAGFIEPLESNGLLTVHEWVIHLLRLMERSAMNQYDIEVYNDMTFNNWRGFADFVAMHYVLSIRNDTEYWRSNANRSVYDSYADSVEIRNNPFFGTAESKMRAGKIAHVNNGINWISVGMNWFINDRVSVMHRFQFGSKLKGYANEMRRYENNFRSWELRKEKWRKNALNSPTLYEFQKKHIYQEE